MENSVIIGYLVFIFSALKKYYKNSNLEHLVQGMQNCLKRSREQSYIISTLAAESRMNEKWKESNFYGKVFKTVRLIKKAILYCWSRIGNMVRNSSILAGVDNILSNIFNYSIRNYGAFLFALLAVEGMLWMAFQVNELKYVLIRAVLLAAAAIMFLIDVPVAAFFKGSSLFRFVENGFEDSLISYNSSKAVETKNLLIIMLTGAIIGIAAYVLPAKLLLAAVAGTISVVLILWKYEIGVYFAAGFAAILPTSAMFLIMAATIFSFACRWAVGKVPKYKATLIDGLIAMFFAVLVYSTLTSYFIKDSINVLAVHTLMLIFYLVVTRTIDTRHKLYLLVGLLAISASLTSLYGIYQYYGGAASSAAWVDTTMFQDIESRVGSTFNNPNILGEYLIMMIPLCLSLLWYKKKTAYKVIFMMMLGIMGICMIFTFSRGAWLGLIFALVGFSIVRDKRLFALSLVVLFILPFVLPPSVINRFASIGSLEDTSSAYRMSILIGSLRMVQDFWISGIGLGSQAFKAIYPKYSLAAAYAHHSHNIYLQVILEMGAAGFLVFMLMILVFARAALADHDKTKAKDVFLSSVMLAACAGIAGYMVQGMVENIWYNYRVLQTFWVVLAVGLCAIRLAKGEEQTDA